MKTFILKLILFFTIIAGLDYATGAVMDKIYAGTVKGDYGRNNYIATGVHADCLIFGSSRAIHHYDPDKIGKALKMSCYNCGEDGMGIVTMYGRFKEITDRYTPKVVIYDVVGSFDLSKNDNSKYIGFLRYYTGKSDVLDIITEVDPTEKYKNISRSYKYNTRWVDIATQYISHSPGTAAEYKYAPLEGEITYKVDDDKASKDTDVDSIKLCYFQKMISFCEQKDIKMIFVLSPWYHAKDYDEYQPLIAICNQNHIPLLNHFTDKIFINNPHLFKDQSHLNQKGAELFDEIVSKEIEKVK